MSSPTVHNAPRFERAKWETRMWLAARSVRLRRWMWSRSTYPSAFVLGYLTGLKGIEIGASAHNDYAVDAINVDRFASLDTQYKREEWNLCGRIRGVDLVAAGDDLPFRDDAVDFVLASHVIEHFPDPIRAMREWLRVARRYVVVVVPHHDRTFDHVREVTPVDELIQRHAEGFSSDEDKHWSVWTCESFLEMCDRLGFRVVGHQDPDDKMGNGFTVVLEAGEGARPAPGEPRSAEALGRS